eukprot:5792438-Prymnesium_polylepis.1
MHGTGGKDVGCSEFDRKHRKPFRGLPGVDRASGLCCAGNTRVGALAVDPYHLMDARTLSLAAIVGPVLDSP